PLPRAAGRHPLPAAAGAGRVLPAGRLFRHQRDGRRRVLPLADDRTWRGGDPAVAVLPVAAARTAPDPVLLRQVGCHPAGGSRAVAHGLTEDGMDDLRIALVQA